MNRSQRFLLGKAARTVIVLALALLCALPLWYVLINSFKSSIDMITNPMGLPKHWVFSNFGDAFSDGTMLRSFANTIILTVAGVFLQVLIGSMAAFGIVYKRSTFTKIVGGVLMVAFSIPLQATLLPQFKMAAAVGLVNSLLGLVVLYTGSSVFCYFLIVGYMSSLPSELFEAAKIDGAGAGRIYVRIVLPLIKPILTTVVVFQTMSTWNDFLLPSVFLSSTDKQTVVLQVYNAVQKFSTNWPLFMTITVITLIPVFIFFFFCQKWIVSGLVAGSVKG
ncbi:carbohydrate ABC transporter permease [Bifidobacterium mongoliense]|jgi:raffinose/stachyose/melibiose transport system permease protein|uniref:MalG-type ABC sugar transport system permease component n=2 Tax=Bifidobacterium mongoliense TaxID=518643 RepID=A0A087C1J2_9BIFI|nr:carbohydrate ABC transporter permease [Bifidobacterium mongoliense]KFI77142.1 MalG-type ABC sugar transport system permease component [Bifidobacterium mongoliense DSM 21395]MDN5632905.1 carbohydrate ABC transporter permease [Bifidobacterium mongoliense]MDN6803162.1 carbohydrate ABC transporter permease [Bifidobacterium mongoliense]ROT87856.1 ABC transporter permease [Bifidobacterium mongoliense]